MSNSIDDTNDSEQQCCNDESDNLSEWQYLTATFDNDQMFTSDVESTRMSKWSLDRVHSDNTTSQDTTHAAPLKRSRSNSTIYDELHHAYSMSRGVTNPFDTALLQRERELEHNHHNSNIPSKKHGTTTSLSQCEEGQLGEFTELLVKSWSHPQLRSQTLPQSVSRCQNEIPTSNFTYHPIELSHFPSQSISLSERSERYRFLSGHVDDNEANHVLKLHESLGTTQLPYVPLSNSHVQHANPNEFILSQSFVRDNHVEAPRPCTPHEKNASSGEHRLSGTYSFVGERIAHKKEMMANATPGINVNESAGTCHQSAPANTLGLLDQTISDQQMRTWMSMLGTPSSIPPFQQFGDKKLLLHPLTPYNYYYRDERDNIVSQISDENDPLPSSVSDFTIARMQALLHQHWFIDPIKKKRKHRKSHGKMNFQQLSKVIAQRWHQLPHQGRDFYRSVSRYDDLYYHQQLDTIKQRSDL